ncbi:MAG: ATP-binding protein [Catalinimonas sp.]
MLQRHEFDYCLDNLQKIRSFVNSSLLETPLEESERHMVVVAVDEICANLVIHSMVDDPKCHFEVGVEMDSDNQEIVVEVRDEGNAFDPTIHVSRTTDEIRLQRRKGGLGLSMVQRIMDRVEYCKDANYNICRMYKVLALPDRVAV